MKKSLVLAGVILLFALGAMYLLTKSDPETRTQALSFSHSHGMALDAEDPNKLYIATHEGLYVLQGEKDLARVGSGRDDLMGFTSHPTRGGTFFSSGHPARGGNIGFQKTEDGGVKWERVSSGINGPVDFHSMTLSQANPDIVYGYFRGLQRSLDGGKSWEMAKGTIAPIALSTHSSKDTLYAATQNGVQMSEDRGDSWKSLSAQLEGGPVSVFFLFPDNSALAFSERLGGLGKSDDGGATWRKLGETFGGGVVLYVAHSLKSGVTYAVTDQHSIYKSVDEGEVWEKVK